MKPIQTPASNALLQLKGGSALNDLPAERVRIFPPGADGDDAQAMDGFESTWQPDAIERSRIANGGLIGLRVWGKQHPPVALYALDLAPDAQVAVIDAEHVRRALELMFLRFVQDLDSVLPQLELHAGDRKLTVPRSAWLEAWEVSLRDSANMDAPAPPPAAPAEEPDQELNDTDGGPRG